MAETINIAKMAELLSADLFGEFRWQQTGPMNENFSCEDKSHARKTHPADVVFYYDNPYSLSRTYVHTDLKSYAENSINATSVSSAVEDLAESISCAEKSKEWQDRFTHANVSADVAGMLFVYNHDGEYDKSFSTLRKRINTQNLEIPRRSKIVVFGPEDIFWLNNVASDMMKLRGKKEIPDREQCRFYYPNLIMKKNVQPDNAFAATLEMLTSPWIIFSYPKNSRKGFIVYYRRRGETREEFEYLIDYFMNCQIPFDESEIHVRALSVDKRANSFFEQAVAQYVEECDKSLDIKQRLKNIDFTVMAEIQTRFSTTQIGMQR